MSLLRANLLLLFLLLGPPAFSAAPSAAAEPWELAEPGLSYQFPRDHRNHPSFKTEWWYFTGQLKTAAGRLFGYQITFFRQGIRPPSERKPGESRFIVNDLKFAHFAISDIQDQHYYFAQKNSRGAFGEAGFSEDRLAWIDDWELRLRSDGGFDLTANDGGYRLTLHLESDKPPAIQGENGVSQKANGEGHASYYYSFTRMRSEGEITWPAGHAAVTGETWFDHEWASNQLTAEQIGWNWFSLQLSDGSEIMLYQLRTRAGGIDPNSSGTLVDASGKTHHLKLSDFHLQPVEIWKSPKSGASYPLRWRLEIPTHQITLEIETPMKSQELVFDSIAYWEGLITVQGSQGTTPLSGHGYMELTGYSGALVGLQEKK